MTLVLPATVTWDRPVYEVGLRVESYDGDDEESGLGLSPGSSRKPDRPFQYLVQFPVKIASSRYNMRNKSRVNYHFLSLTTLNWKKV